MKVQTYDIDAEKREIVINVLSWEPTVLEFESLEAMKAFAEDILEEVKQ